jgi:hypothetical protein
MKNLLRPIAFLTLLSLFAATAQGMSSPSNMSLQEVDKNRRVSTEEALKLVQSIQNSIDGEVQDFFSNKKRIEEEELGRVAKENNLSYENLKIAYAKFDVIGRSELSNFLMTLSFDELDYGAYFNRSNSRSLGYVKNEVEKYGASESYITFLKEELNRFLQQRAKILKVANEDLSLIRNLFRLSGQLAALNIQLDNLPLESKAEQEAIWAKKGEIYKSIEGIKAQREKNLLLMQELESVIFFQQKVSPPTRIYLYAVCVNGLQSIPKLYFHVPAVAEIILEEPSDLAEYTLEVEAGGEKLKLIAKPYGTSKKVYRTEVFVPLQK